MNLKTRRFFGLVLIAAIVLPTTGCAYSGGPIEGRVLEEGTDKPIPGVIVVARWEGTAFSFVENPTVCIHVETATTDKDGRYRIPFWHASAEPAGVHGIEPIVTAYKAGYQWPRKLPKSLDDEMQYLRPFVGTREERFKASRIAGIKCPNAGSSQRNLIPLYKTIYEQLATLALTKDEKLYANSYLNAIEEIELPEEEATRRDLVRRERIRNENN